MSVKSLKDEKPVWFCIPQHFGSIGDLAQSGKILQYVTESTQISNVWRVIGNPKFRNEYAYLLVSFHPESGILHEVYGVKTSVEEDGKKKTRAAKCMANIPAFEGTVDKINFGWGSRAHVKHMLEHGFVQHHEMF